MTMLAEHVDGVIGVDTHREPSPQPPLSQRVAVRAVAMPRGTIGIYQTISPTRSGRQAGSAHQRCISSAAAPMWKGVASS